MPNYKYQVIGPGGQSRPGVRMTYSAASAASVLLNQGVHVISIDEAKERIG